MWIRSWLLKVDASQALYPHHLQQWYGSDNANLLPLGVSSTLTYGAQRRKLSDEKYFHLTKMNTVIIISHHFHKHSSNDNIRGMISALVVSLYVFHCNPKITTNFPLRWNKRSHIGRANSELVCHVSPHNMMLEISFESRAVRTVRAGKRLFSGVYTDVSP